MEVHIGLGGVYKQPPGKMIRGAFENLFLSVREAFQGERRASADSAAPAATWRGEPAAATASHPTWGDPPEPAWSEARATPAGPWREAEPAATVAGGSPGGGSGEVPPFCHSELKEILGEQGGMLEAERVTSEPVPKESYPVAPEVISDSAKEICKAVSVSLGLNMDALEHLGAGGDVPRGDCMFAGAPSHPLETQKCQVAEEDKSDASSPQYHEGAFRRSGQSSFSPGKAPEDGSSGASEDKQPPCSDLALPEPGGFRSRCMELAPSLTLYKPTAFMEETPAYPAREYYSFQMALTPHSRIKVESPMEFGGSAWGAPSRYGDFPGFPHCAPAANWHSLFEDGQTSAPYSDASIYSYSRSHVPPGADSEFPADTWYPASAMLGRVPYGSPMKTEMTPWMEGYPGAFGEMRYVV